MRWNAVRPVSNCGSLTTGLGGGWEAVSVATFFSDEHETSRDNVKQSKAYLNISLGTRQASHLNWLPTSRHVTKLSARRCTGILTARSAWVFPASPARTPSHIRGRTQPRSSPEPCHYASGSAIFACRGKPQSPPSPYPAAPLHCTP